MNTEVIETIFPDVCRQYLSGDVDFAWVEKHYKGRISDSALVHLEFAKRIKIHLIEALEEILPGLPPEFDPTTFVNDCLRHISGNLQDTQFLLKYGELPEQPFSWILDTILMLKRSVDEAFEDFEAEISKREVAI